MVKYGTTCTQKRKRKEVVHAKAENGRFGHASLSAA